VVASSQKTSFSRAERSPCRNSRQARTLLDIPTMKKADWTVPPLVEAVAGASRTCTAWKPSPRVNDEPAKAMADQNRR
jgi:hypothetical protein